MLCYAKRFRFFFTEGQLVCNRMPALVSSFSWLFCVVLSEMPSVKSSKSNIAIMPTASKRKTNVWFLVTHSLPSEHHLQNKMPSVKSSKSNIAIMLTASKRKTNVWFLVTHSAPSEHHLLPYAKHFLDAKRIPYCIYYIQHFAWILVCAANISK